MKKWFAVAMTVALACGALLMGSGTVRGETPPEAGLYFECCEEMRDNPTEYDRCVGDELNKQRAIMAKNDELNLDRCNGFLVPYHKLKYEQCVGEEFNKFPEYGPEVMEQYLAGEPWSWSGRDPEWWDDYFPVTTPETEGEFHRWWEGDFYISPQPSPNVGGDMSTWQNDWGSGRSPLVGNLAPPEW